MMPAAKHGDPQLGVDIHLCVVPPSPSPVPLPTPHMSIVFDPFDYIPYIGATVTVCGMKRATAGTNATVVHIPPGFPFAPKLPDKDDELFMGSKTVVADGDPFSFIGVPVLGCQVAGMVSIPRLKKKSSGKKLMLLPTTFNLAIPTSVFVGGPPTISLIGMLSKLGFAALGKFAKSALFKRIRQKLFGHLKPGFLKCIILRAEPVNIVTGEASVGQEDFTLTGRIPIQWVRSYSSANARHGLCGYGWETPGDGRLEVDPPDGHVLMLYPRVGPLSFARLPTGEGEAAAELELMDGARLYDDGVEFRVRMKEDRTYHFRKADAIVREDGRRELPLSRISDLCGNWLEFEHHAGRLLSINESAGRRIVVGIDHGRISRLALQSPGVDSPHVFVRYEYDASEDLVAVVDALGNPYRFSYDEHHLTRHTDRNALSFCYEYDKQATDEWRVVHAWGDGNLYNYRFEYIDALNERRIVDSLGNVSLIKLDDRSLPIAEIDPLGGMTIYEYDDAGRTTAVTDPAGRRTEYEFDDRGNLLNLLRPDGTAFLSAFDADDRITEITDPNGGAWRQRWDTRGRLVEQISPMGNVCRYDYDGHGQLTALTNPRGGRTELARDPLGHLAVLKDPLGHSTRFATDLFGNVTEKIDALDRKTVYRYDLKSRLIEVRLPSGSTIRCRYDAENRLTHYVDENGAETRLEYSGLGEIARHIQPDGHTAEYFRDTEERLIRIRNQRGEHYELRRDTLGRIVEEIDYWGQAHRYAYDAGGYLVASIDAQGRRIDYATDPLGRIVKRLLPGGVAEEFVYDANGNLTGIKNVHAEITRAFDAEGRLLQEAQGGSFTIENTYDATGNRIARKTSLGNIVEYEFDMLGQVASVRINGAEPTGIGRDLTGQITHERLSSTLARSLRHNPDGLVTEQSVTAAERPVFATRYEHDHAGNLTRQVDSQYGADTFRYDPLGRILGHINPRGRLTRYLYDPAGGRLASRTVSGGPHADSPTGDAWHRLEEYEGAQYRFDRAGNLVERFDGNGNLQLVWDANQRLIESRTNDTITRFGYDPLGRRLFKETDGVRTLFFWDGHALVAEHLVSANTGDSARRMREYVYYPGTFEPLAMVVSDSNLPQVFHYHNHPNGCPMRLLDPAGLVVWAARYDAWGAVAELYIEDQDNPLRLQGQYYDAEIDLCYNLRRYYDPQRGCFISQDPVGLAAGLNVYAYAPNVWNWLDPLGLACKEVERGIEAAEQKLSHYSAAVDHARRSIVAQPAHADHWKKFRSTLQDLERKELREHAPDEEALETIAGMIAHVDAILAP